MRSTKTPQNSFPCTLLHSLFINIVEETAKIIWSCSWTKIVCVFHYYVQVHSCRIVSLSSPLPLASLWASSWCWHNCGRLLVLSHFGTCMCSNVETNLSWTCLVSGPLNFEHPSVLLFCLKLLGCGETVTADSQTVTVCGSLEEAALQYAVVVFRFHSSHPCNSSASPLTLNLADILRFLHKN